MLGYYGYHFWLLYSYSGLLWLLFWLLCTYSWLLLLFFWVVYLLWVIRVVLAGAAANFAVIPHVAGIKFTFSIISPPITIRSCIHTTRGDTCVGTKQHRIGQVSTRQHNLTHSPLPAYQSQCALSLTQPSGIAMLAQNSTNQHKLAHYNTQLSTITKLHLHSHSPRGSLGKKSHNLAQVNTRWHNIAQAGTQVSTS